MSHNDVIIIGAGLSGIGAGYHLQRYCPDRSYLILEARSRLGGTWDKFRYPGIRSDSDMYTFGYSFKPWNAPKTISDGPSILAYLQETADDYGITDRIRFNRRMIAAHWSTRTATWTVTVEVTEDRSAHEEHDDVHGNGGTGTTDHPETRTVIRTERHTANFLMMCSGYYSYATGYQPTFEGQDDFAGPIIHPQDWPEYLDYTGKNVAVIGSGATAVTLLPALAEDAAHVTMIQRSPGYLLSRPSADPAARLLKRFLPDSWAHRIIRRRNIRLGTLLYNRTRTDPDRVKAFLINGVRKGLNPDIDVDRHFTPRYNPWDQRLCLIPDGDLFDALNSGKASVVTDHVDRFVPEGVRMASGDIVEADIIVTATGLQLVTLGEADFFVDDDRVDFSRTWTYKGLAYSDIPNMVSVFGYINQSWTLRSDMISRYLCRLLNHMAETGADIVVPRLRPSDHDMTPRPWIDDFSSGYMQRMMPLLPRQGDREPWLNTQRYERDVELIAKADVADDVLQFSAPERVPTGSGRR